MCTAGNTRNTVDPNGFNREAELPYALRMEDFQMRTATLHKDGVKKRRENRIYRAG